MDNPVQIRRNWTPSHPRARLPVTFRRSLSSSPTASSGSSPSEHSGNQESSASSGETDDEARSGGMPPSPPSLSSSPVQLPVTALSETEQHMREEEPFSLAALAPAQLAPTDMDSASRLSAVEPSAEDPNAASLPGEENLQGSVSLLDWGSLVLISLTDIRMASPSAHSFNSNTPDWNPLLPSLLPRATPPSEPTFVASTSAHPQEDASDNFFVQFGQEMVHYLAAKHGFTQHVILKVFEKSGDLAATDVILGEMADAAELVLHRRCGNRESEEPTLMMFDLGKINNAIIQSQYMTILSLQSCPQHISKESQQTFQNLVPFKISRLLYFAGKSAKPWACGTSPSIIMTQQAVFGKNGAQMHGTGKIKLCQTVGPNSNGSTNQSIWCQPVNQPPESMSRSRVLSQQLGSLEKWCTHTLLKIELSRHGQGHG
ncbi:hypothetical protein B0H16DRAFT_1484248 [Mycena metata]|uniref:Uncharacterized protein n=1 Tax=Mycena metata TaxID=1033252 RepID=A0AAD7DU38_9AGAR|nr:hypothetical protein B0H16DRAFT_1484248 [Mycena metata]